jgi:hypothetical protein
MKRPKLVAAVSVLVLLANASYARLNPLLADELGCGGLCRDYTECSQPCYICFPNPLEPPGTCISLKGDG